MVMKIALFSMSLARKYVHRFKIIKIFIQVYVCVDVDGFFLQVNDINHRKDIWVNTGINVYAYVSR